MRSRVIRALAGGLAVAATLLGAGPGAVTATAAGTAGLSNLMVTGIVVSPAYARTGLVVVAGIAQGCHSSCNRLFVSHDGGSTWTQAAASGWQNGLATLGVAADGREVLFAPGKSSLQRSDDAGQSWRAVGAGGVPTVMPTFASDGGVAVAGGPDYVLTTASAHNVAGTAGAARDTGFFFSPAFPSGGAFAPALVAGGDKNNLPVIARCSADLTCSGSVPLPGAPPVYSLPVTLLPSSTYAQDGVVFAQTARGIFKSTNGGAAFVPLSVGAAGADATTTSMMALTNGYSEAGSSHTIFAAVQQTFSQPTPHTSGGVYRSDDGGKRWTLASHGSYLDEGAIAVAVAPDGRLFAAYQGMSGSGLLCSAAGAWQPSCSPVGSATRGAAPVQQPLTAGSKSCAGSACGAQPAAGVQGGADAGAPAARQAGGPAVDIQGLTGATGNGGAPANHQPGMQVGLWLGGFALAIAALVTAWKRRQSA